MAAKIYHDKDADLKYLKGKTCAVIGYGSQGHAHALNLKDSGVDVRVGLRADSPNAERARKVPAISRRKLDPAPCHRDPDQRRHHASSTSLRPRTARAAAAQSVEIAAPLVRRGLSDRPPQTQSP